MTHSNESLLLRAKEYVKFQFKKDSRLKYKAGFILVVLIAATFVRFQSSKANTIELKKADTARIKKQTEKSLNEVFYIDISGAVNSPGVYKVNKKTRLFELVEKAGGLTESANLDAINQAEFLEDGQKIVIPCKDDESEETGTNNLELGANTSTININIADKNKLTELPGVGDAIAERIIEYRNKNKFTKPEDLKNVKGIGDATFDKLKSLVTV